MLSIRLCRAFRTNSNSEFSMDCRVKPGNDG